MAKWVAGDQRVPGGRIIASTQTQVHVYLFSMYFEVYLFSV